MSEIFTISIFKDILYSGTDLPKSTRANRYSSWIKWLANSTARNSRTYNRVYFLETTSRRTRSRGPSRETVGTVGECVCISVPLYVDGRACVGIRVCGGSYELFRTHYRIATFPHSNRDIVQMLLFWEHNYIRHTLTYYLHKFVSTCSHRCFRWWKFRSNYQKKFPVPFFRRIDIKSLRMNKNIMQLRAFMKIATVCSEPQSIRRWLRRFLKASSWRLHDVTTVKMLCWPHHFHILPIVVN